MLPLLLALVSSVLVPLGPLLVLLPPLALVLLRRGLQVAAHNVGTREEEEVSPSAAARKCGHTIGHTIGGGRSSPPHAGPSVCNTSTMNIIQ